MERIRAGDRARFAQAVSLEQRYPDPLPERIQHLDRQRRCTAQADAQRQVGRQVNVYQRPVKLRDCGHDGRRVA